MNRALGVFVACLLVGACATPAPSASPVESASRATETAIPAETAAEATDMPAVDAAWQRVPLPDDDAALNAIVAAGSDVVIVGADDVEKPASWTSHNGGAWTTEPLPAGSGIPGTAIRLGDRIVVMGGMETSRCAHPAQATFAVRDANGRWTTAPFDPLFCAASGSASVAVSGNIAAVLGTGTGDQPFAWFSHDGLRWVDSGLAGDILPRALASARREFVALGTGAEGRWWFGRTDGMHGWALEAALGLPQDLAVVSIAEGGDGLVAWFRDDSGDDHAFTSAGGETWRAFTQRGRDNTHMRIVRQVDRGYIALAEDAGGQLMLVSVDGESWREVPRPAVIEPTGIFREFAVSGRTLYLLAQSQPDAPIWLLNADLSQFGS